MGSARRTERAVILTGSFAAGRRPAPLHQLAVRYASKAKPLNLRSPFYSPPRADGAGCKGLAPAVTSEAADAATALLLTFPAEGKSKCHSAGMRRVEYIKYPDIYTTINNHDPTIKTNLQ